jgi:hypothetical protein
MPDVVIAVVAAALMMSPSYIGYIAINRLKLSVSIGAVGALALFLVGAFLLLRLLKD